MNPKLKHIYTGLKKNNLDLLFVTSAANISYLMDYPSRDSYLLISKKANIYFTDSRYTEEAKARLKGKAKIIEIKGPLFKMIADTSRKLGGRRIGFEETNLTFENYKRLKQALSQNMNLLPAASLIEAQREIKNNQEIKKIKEAARITIAAFGFIRKFLKPGVKEIEVAAELERFIRYKGAQASAFDIIVASGKNSSFPHHITSAKKIRNNEPVLIDVGVEYSGYKSDLTRVFFLGKMSSLYREIYEIVLQAQTKAINKIEPDVLINTIDTAARESIRQAGYAENFTHALGHGIGLETHEAPRVSGKNINALKPGMVLTVEPAIYLPGKFGVRLEDMVLVTRKGCVILSGSLNK
ncbi:MAG: aminopeptidase P family protein [Candidatus Omnitrophica bacterium]|nr:aminopeptidase P family protein [Candidatus Omnitrophota bacterium]